MIAQIETSDSGSLLFWVFFCKTSIFLPEGGSAMEKKIYKASDVQRMLCLSNGKTYELIREAYANNGPFRVIKVGNSYRVVKSSFDKWLEKGVS